jgi:hypothetical protein
MGRNAIMLGETITTPDKQPSPTTIPKPKNPDKQPLPPDPFKIPIPAVTPDTEPTPKA